MNVFSGKCTINKISKHHVPYTFKPVIYLTTIPVKLRIALVVVISLRSEETIQHTLYPDLSVCVSFPRLVGYFSFVKQSLIQIIFY